MNNPVAHNSIALLRQLEPAVRPGSTGPGGRAAPASFEARPFDDLLAQAFAGELRSERPVDVACDLKPAMDASQMKRLASAADRAEAFGGQRTLMMIDGRGVVMDVRNRCVIAEMKPQDSSAMLAVDGAMIVPADDADAGSRGSPFAGLNALTAARVGQSAGGAARSLPGSG